MRKMRFEFKALDRIKNTLLFSHLLATLLLISKRKRKIYWASVVVDKMEVSMIY